VYYFVFTKEIMNFNTYIQFVPLIILRMIRMFYIKTNILFRRKDYAYEFLLHTI